MTTNEVREVYSQLMKNAAVDENGKWTLAIEDMMAMVDAFRDWRPVTEPEKMSASEALFGFVGWLTCRKEAITMSGHHNAADAVDVIAAFIKENDLDEPVGDWHKLLTHPTA